MNNIVITTWTITSIILLFYVHNSFNRNIIKVFHLPKWFLLLVDFIFLTTMISRLLFRFAPSLTSSIYFKEYITVSYVLLGLIGLISLMIIILDLEHVFHILSSKFISNKNQQPEGRRAFLKKSFTLGGIAGSGVVTGIGFYNSFDPKIKRVTVPLKAQFKNLSGLRIAQLSDIHIGPTLRSEFSEKLVKLVNQEKVDIVVITGDLVDGEVHSTGKDVEPLKNLKGKLGTYYVTGNHEYYWDGEGWINFVDSLGIQPLINKNKELNFNGEKLFLCGVSDIQTRRMGAHLRPDFKKAAEGTDPNAYRIILSHQPTTCFEAVRVGYNLQLSGHTHGGQGFPWNIIVRFVQPYIKGLYNHEGMDLYVNAGTGFWGPPNRFMEDSEITILELKHLS